MTDGSIFYSKQSYTEREVELVTDALRNGVGNRAYEYVDRFEAVLARFLGAKFVLATSSCTGANHVALAALGISPGDEVILADVNWIATVAPVLHLGGKPVFVDILEDSWCLDPARVEAAITPKTKAIIAVHLYGNVCAMKELQAIGAKFRVPVVEDAAEAIGSRWHGQHVGTFGTFGTFSFHHSKTITTGEGGALVTSDEALYDRAWRLNNHGRSRRATKQLWPECVGFKYRMSNLLAAVGCAQMERIDALLADKKRIFAGYQARLRDLPIKMNKQQANVVNGYWMPTVVVDAGVPFDRDALFKRFADDAIDTRVFFWPLSSLPMFDRIPANEVSYRIAQRAFNLPSYHGLSEAQMDRVAGHVRRYLGGSRL